MDFTRMLIDAGFDLIPVNVRPHLMPAVCMAVGLITSAYTLHCLRAGYVYLDWKWSFTAENRVYREADPIWFWFGILTYGSLGFGALGFAVYGVFFYR